MPVTSGFAVPYFLYILGQIQQSETTDSHLGSLLVQIVALAEVCAL